MELPRSLKNAVDSCLASSFPMAVIWGKADERVANDAYRAAFGDRWVTALEPHLARARAGETCLVEDQRILIDRRGSLQETYFSSSFSPIRDESGVAGVLHVAHETTPKILAERRARLLFDLARRTASGRSIDKVFNAAIETLSGQPDVASASFHDPRDDDDRQMLIQLERPLLMPIPASEPVAILRLGPSKLTELDDAYHSFFDRIASTIASAVAMVRVHSEEQRRADTLEELDEKKATFVNALTHDLHTPLSLLLAQMDEALSDRSQALTGLELKVARRSTLHLTKLANQLLDFCRMESRRARGWFQPTDLAALTKELAILFRPAVEKAKLSLIVECDTIAEPIFVDQELWEKIVMNLLSNALQFTFEGRIVLSLRLRGDLVVLSVSDTSGGIPESELERAFERFHRLPGPRRRTVQGAGIGLALVSELVALHGGEIGVSSEVGKGTTFTVYLRRGSAHLPAGRVGVWKTKGSTASRNEQFIDETPEMEEEESPTSELSAGRILVVEDDDEMRGYLGRLLARRWTVEKVGDVRAALEAIEHQKFDLILADLLMPAVDGLALLRRIRSRPETATLPVLLLSVRGDEQARIDGLRAGADDFLEKPFSSRELMARVETHLRLSQVRAHGGQQWKKLLVLLEQLPLPISIWAGPEYRYEFVNEAHRRAAGRDLTGLLIREVATWNEESFALIDRAYRAGEPITMDEHPFELEEGQQERRFNSILQPVRDDDGQVRGILRVSVDVTEQVAAREQREQLLARIESARAEAVAANRAKDEFLAMLGHELRNPLSPIMTAVELMRLRGQQSKEQDIIERQVGHLTRLVDDLLDISRITRGAIKLQREVVDLSELAGRAIETVSPMLDQRRQRLEANVPRGIPINADPDRVVQIVSNLLTNASRYSPPGARILVRAERAGERARISVKDEGVGIPPEMLERIFGPFVQQPQSIERAKGGLGLGLAIVKSLVGLHGGTVSAHSDGVGKGSEFVVDLRLAGASNGADVGPLRKMAAKGRVQRRRILVVDDNDDLADTLARALSALGHHVEVAYDGPSALAAATIFAPEIALLDIGLPVMDGYELARRLREGNGATRLVAVTGYGQQRDRELAAEAGFERHLVKPIDLAKLQSVVEELS